MLRQQRKFILEQGKIGRDYAVLDVPLLLEAGFWRCCDFVINVDVHKSLQWHRLRQRGLSEREIEFLLSLQMPRGSRRNFADFYVNCGGAQRRGTEERTANCRELKCRQAPLPSCEEKTRDAQRWTGARLQWLQPDAC